MLSLSDKVGVQNPPASGVPPRTENKFVGPSKAQMAIDASTPASGSVCKFTVTNEELELVQPESVTVYS